MELARTIAYRKQASVNALTCLLLTACPCPTPEPPPEPEGTTAAIVNRSGVDTTVFIAFGADSVVTADTFSSFCPGAGLNCSFPLAKQTKQELPLAGAYLNATVSFFQPVGCDTTKAELNLNNPSWYDISDVSLVDGFNVPMQVTFGATVLGPVVSADHNESAFGVYPLGCDICVARQSPPCGLEPGETGCKSGSQYDPSVPCQAQGSILGGGDNRVVVELLDIEPA